MSEGSADTGFCGTALLERILDFIKAMPVMMIATMDTNIATISSASDASCKIVVRKSAPPGIETGKPERMMTDWNKIL